jgi:type I restriction enzyme S subunit
LAEQKRIVALLDEAFAGIDEAMAKAEGLELKSKELRASVLSRLLEPTEVNTKARWSDRSLGEVCDILDYKRRPVTKADRRAGPYPYYGATGVQDYVDQFIFDEPLVLLGEDGAKWKSGDRSAFLVSGKTWVNNHAHVLRPNREIIADEWLVYWLNHSDLTDFITGVTVPKLNQGNMVKIPVPLPPLDEQRRIVALLDKAFAGTGELSSHASRKMSELSELKSSLLSQAFAGELTA